MTHLLHQFDFTFKRFLTVLFRLLLDYQKLPFMIMVAYQNAKSLYRNDSRMHQDSSNP